MEKPAEPDYPILDLLKRRWSPRAFSPRMVEPQKLLSLFEAVRWAASAFNEQPWHFLIATKEQPEEYARLLDCLAEKNQQWAHAAPVLGVSVAKLAFERTGKANRTVYFDVGLGVGNLLVQATALDLFVHQMAGFSSDKVRELYQIPEGFEPVAALAIGYAGELEELPESFRAAEVEARTRKPIESFVFEGSWGNPSALIAN
jgi:nitroreductase